MTGSRPHFTLRDWLFAALLGAVTIGVPIGLAVAIAHGALQ